MASIFKRGDKWRAQIRRKGHEPLSESFETKAEAQRWAREQEHRMDQGKRTPAGLRFTLGHIIDRYEDEISTRAVGRTKKRILKFLKRRFAAVRLDEFTKQSVLNFVSEREADGVVPATIMGEVLYLKTALRYGGPMVDAEEATAMALARFTAAYDFLVHARRLSNPESRQRRPTPAQLEEIIGFFREKERRDRRCLPMADITELAVACALRRGEIVGPGGIRADDINQVDRTILIRERKHPDGTEANDEIIPLLRGPIRLGGEVVDPLAILTRQPAIRLGVGRLFPYSESAVSQAFRKACDGLGIEDLHFHDLRHESISRMFEAGMEIQQVALVSGHKDWKNLKRYTHLQPKELHGQLVSLK